MFTRAQQTSPDFESKAHLDPRRYDIISERWLFHAPELRVPQVPLEFPVPVVRFHSATAETPKAPGIVSAGRAA